MIRREASRREFLAAVAALAATRAVSASTTAARTPVAPLQGPDTVRFGVTALQGASYGEILTFWRTADSLGFDSAFVYDHFMGAATASTDAQRCLESWTLLSALAAKTERIRLGVLVSGAGYRYPAILAKMAATVDQVSRGRLILGMGAGWLEREFVAYGIPFYTKGGRAKRLVEAVEVVKQLFTQERSTYNGKYFTLKDAPCEPKPVQRPHPPILIGGMGPKIVQPLAARHAQIWHFLVPGAEPAEIRKLCENFDGLCRDVGRDPREIEKATSLLPTLAQGSVKDALAQIHALKDAGIRHFILLPPAGNDRGVLRWFASEIIPELRGK